MTIQLADDEAAFLREVASMVPPKFRDVDFPNILARLVAWSHASHRQLHKQPPGEQPTVAFALGTSPYALWKSYARRKDGAKVEVTTRLLHRLVESDKALLLGSLADFAPTVKVSDTGVLMMPMHLLAEEDAISSFLELLSRAREAVIRVRSTAG